MDGHTGIIAVSGAGGEGQDMVAALWMNPGLDQGILQQLIKSHSHIREPPGTPQKRPPRTPAKRKKTGGSRM